MVGVLAHCSAAFALPVMIGVLGSQLDSFHSHRRSRMVAVLGSLAGSRLRSRDDRLLALLGFARIPAAPGMVAVLGSQSARVCAPRDDRLTRSARVFARIPVAPGWSGPSPHSLCCAFLLPHPRRSQEDAFRGPTSLALLAVLLASPPLPGMVGVLGSLARLVVLLASPPLPGMIGVLGSLARLAPAAATVLLVIGVLESLTPAAAIIVASMLHEESVLAILAGVSPAVSWTTTSGSTMTTNSSSLSSLT